MKLAEDNFEPHQNLQEQRQKTFLKTNIFESLPQTFSIIQNEESCSNSPAWYRGVQKVHHTLDMLLAGIIKIQSL